MAIMILHVVLFFVVFISGDQFIYKILEILITPEGWDRL